MRLRGEVGGCEDEGLVRKRTKVMTNSQEVARRVAQKCAGGHCHVNLIGGRAKRALLFFRTFSWALCQGVAAQKRFHALALRTSPMLSIDEMAEAARKINGQEELGPSLSEMLHEEEFAMVGGGA